MMSHLPTLMLVIGYVVFWLELYVIPLPQGHTSWLAAVLFLAFILKNAGRYAAELKPYREIWIAERKSWPIVVKAGIALGLLFLVVNILIAGYAAFLPVHLTQEADALNYHISLPRQHLILESFRHIAWSSADLWPLPVDFALAPYILATEWPNKIPQFILFLGLLGVVVKLASRLGTQLMSQAIFVLFGLVGAHFVGIQMGTAMLDLALCYLFFAALDSFSDKKYGWAALEFAFLFWSKPMMPLLWIALTVVLTGVAWIAVRKFRCSLRMGFEEGHLPFDPDVRKKIPRFAAVFLGASLFIGGPFIVKSTYMSGTPVFPVGAGTIAINSQLQNETPFKKGLLQSAQEHLATKDHYGLGRSLGVLPKSLWMMAVPDRGVNNAFDYPLGLPYLLCLGPFLYFLCRALINKIMPLLPMLAFVYGVLWWFGPQQTRFLYIPVVLMMLTVFSQKSVRSAVLLWCLAGSMGLVSISLVREHRSDWGKSPYEVLRLKDKELVNINAQPLLDQPAALDFFDIAYAGFPVTAVHKSSPFVITQTHP